MGSRAAWGLMSLWVLPGSEAWAHGIWSHMHVTGWSVENMADGELKAFFDEPEVFEALLFGAAFTDSGYFPQTGALAESSRQYSEYTHWEPFVSAYIAWLHENDPPPWDSLASKKRVAFLMGCAAHGLQDSLFDSLFLYQVDAHDHAGQDEVDPATDGFLFIDGHARFLAEPYFPLEPLLSIYETLDGGITEEVIVDSVEIMTTLYVNETVGPSIAEGLGRTYETRLPWTRVHYMDPEIPASIRAEIFPTMRYLEALWQRLHGELASDDVVVFAFPEAPRRLLGHDSLSPDSWVTLVMGEGVRYEEAVVSWTADGVSVPFEKANTRWGAEWTRLVRLVPSEPLLPGGWYSVHLDPGASRIDGGPPVGGYTLDFQVSCESEDHDDCPDLGSIPVATIDPPEAAPAADTAPVTPKSEGCGCAVAPSAALTSLAPLLTRLWWMVGRRR